VKVARLLATEKLLLVALFLQALFILWHLVSNSMTFTQTGTRFHWSLDFTLWPALFLFVVAAWGILYGQTFGLLLSLLLHAIQVLQWTFADGDRLSFAFSPTITWDLNLGGELPRELNLVALVLTVITLVAWRQRRDLQAIESRPPVPPLL
jgi:hypothetical protein